MKLRPQQRNANKHTEHGLRLLEKSVQRDGFIDAQTAAADGEIISGSARLELSAEKFADVEPIIVHSDGKRPIVVIRDDIPNLDDPRAKRLSVAANQIAHTDYEMDGELLKEWAAEDTDIKALFVESEWREITGEENPVMDAEPQFDRAAELLEKWNVKMGEMFAIGEHRLICGDCTDAAVVARVMGEGQIDLVLTDPPYSVDYAAKNRALQTIGPSNRLTTDIEGDMLSTKETAEQIWSPAFENAYNHSRNGAVIYCFSPQGGDQMMMMMMMMMRAKWNDSLHQLIWRKNVPTFAMGRLDYQYQHEPILYTWKGTNHGYYSDVGRSVIDCDRPSASKLHPTMKPVELFEMFICNSSKEGEIVYEPFSGSGTTLVACQNLNRRGRAIEISPAYVAVTLERMATAFPELEIKRLE